MEAESSGKDGELRLHSPGNRTVDSGDVKSPVSDYSDDESYQPHYRRPDPQTENDLLELLKEQKEEFKEQILEFERIIKVQFQLTKLNPLQESLVLHLSCVTG